MMYDPSMQKFAVAGLMNSVWNCVPGSGLWKHFNEMATAARRKTFDETYDLSEGKWKMQLDLRGRVVDSKVVSWGFTFNDVSLGAVGFSFLAPSFTPQTMEWMLGTEDSRRSGWGSPVFTPMFAHLQNTCREFVMARKLVKQGRGVLVRNLFAEV